MMQSSKNTTDAPDVESSTEDYATRFHGAVGQWFLEIQKQTTLAMLPRKEGGLDILDVGGGHGQNLGCLLDVGHRVTVTGSDPSCAVRIQDDLARAGARFVECSLTDLPFENEAFDWVVSYRMMTHVEDWPRLVSELCRVSRYGVIVDYPTYRSFNCLQRLLFAWKKGVEKNTRTYHVFHERTVLEAFNREGLALHQRVGQFVLPMAFHRAHKNRTVAVGMEGCFRLLGISWLFGSPVIASFRKKG